ncbi:hypothetical protein [Salinactinospora qingdaonensis]|uniref:Lsr2 protein n=1 Tax=Salinactinospora qingdaonensis TaxID=702744 RepID=A0ABP7FXZ4_9ACTN
MSPLEATVARLHRRFPGATIWHGSHTRQWWALLPGHPRLMEAATPEALEQLITAVGATGHRDQPHGRHPRTREQPGGQRPQRREQPHGWHTHEQYAHERSRERHTREQYAREWSGERPGAGWVPPRPARPRRPDPPARGADSTTTAPMAAVSAGRRPVRPRHRRRRDTAPS